MGKFRQLMQEELELRGYSDSTKRQYLSCVRHLVRYFRRSPAELDAEHLRQFQLYLTRERKVAWSTFNLYVCALRFFYAEVLGQGFKLTRIAYRKKARQLPEILSGQEVLALFEAVGNLEHRALLMTVYAAGLRTCEVVRLRVSDIDSHRMLIRVEQSKGRKDRYVMLSETLLPVLREYWKSCRPQGWLFPGQEAHTHLSRRTARQIFYNARAKAGLRKRVSIHSLRHCFASHLLEGGTNIRIVQRLLGHRSIRSTSRYLHVASNYLSVTPSPLDQLLEMGSTHSTKS